MNRTRSVVVLLVTLVALAGCTGTLFSTEATPATVPVDAYESAGYAPGNTTAIPLTYTVGAAGLSRNVTVTSWLSGYSKTTPDNQTSGLIVLSTPDVEVAGESLNPFGRASDGVLLDRVLDSASSLGTSAWVDDVSDLREVETTERRVLDTPTNVTTYAGSVDAEGTRIGVLVHVMAVAHDGDVVVAIAVHPETMDETEALGGLLERIEHEKPE